MNDDECNLSDLVNDIIIDAGFDEEVYVFIDKVSEIYVEFDDKKSADYLLYVAKDYDEVCSGYSHVQKRHRITFFLW